MTADSISSLKYPKKDPLSIEAVFLSFYGQKPLQQLAQKRIIIFHKGLILNISTINFETIGVSIVQKLLNSLGIIK